MSALVIVMAVLVHNNVIITIMSFCSCERWLLIVSELQKNLTIEPVDVRSVTAAVIAAIASGARWAGPATAAAAAVSAATTVIVAATAIMIVAASAAAATTAATAASMLHTVVT